MTASNVTESKRKRSLADVPEEVAKRWGRMKMAARGQAFGRFYIRYWLLYKERKKRRILEDTFDAIKNLAIRYERDGYNVSLTVYNIALYLLIAERDIQAVKIDALTHPDPWKRNLCIRVILLILHEWDMDKVTGERLKKAFTDLNVSAEIRKEAVESLRAVRKVQQKAQKKLGDLRNATIAHRDPDALLQYRAIRNLKTNDVFHLAIEFYEAADRFISLVPQIMLEAGSMKALVAQVIKKAQNQA